MLFVSKYPRKTFNDDDDDIEIFVNVFANFQLIFTEKKYIVSFSSMLCAFV